MDYESSTSLGDGKETGIRSSGGMKSSGGIASSLDSALSANDGYKGVDDRKRAKRAEMALAGFANAFKDAFGFELIIKPDSAGRAIYGDGKIILELSIPQPVAAVAGEETVPSYPFRGYIESVAGTPKIRIQNGDINSAVPPEVQGGGSPTDYDTDDYVYYVSAEFDDDGLFAGTVAVGRGASVPDDTDTMAYRRIFEVQDGAVLQSVQNSLEVASCGVGVYSWGSV